MTMRCHWRVWLLILGVGWFLGCANTYAEPSRERPRLVVLVVFDQLRGDYLTQWQDQFQEGGFRRLQEDGAWFTNCHYPYGGTWTAAGHASLLAGCSPLKHGIIANDWYDRQAGRSVYCVSSPRYKRVPPPTGAAREESIAPTSFKSVTLADSLKQSTQGKGRVVALSLKDRSAVLPAGRKPDACYWFDTDNGEFVTSNYYRAVLHPWVKEFNESKLVDTWYGKDWKRFRPDLDYVKLAGKDDVPGESTGIKQGRTFPHAMTGGVKERGPAYYRALYTSPAGNDLLWALAKEAVKAENLGADDVPDLLVVSFSSNDSIGHAWGPDSQEVLDVTLRTDATVRQMLTFLDEKVGEGRYVLALTADHGVCPIPEVARAKGLDAGRVDEKALLAGAEAHLNKAFPSDDAKKPRWIETTSGEWVFLDLKLIEQRGLDRDEVTRELARWLGSQDGIAAAYTRKQLANPKPKDDPTLLRMANSYFAERSGDVAVVAAPNHLIGSKFRTGTTHGSPHSYDTHVPLLVFGTGVKPGKHDNEVSPTCISAIFATALGIDPPADAEVPSPEGVFHTQTFNPSREP